MALNHNINNIIFENLDINEKIKLARINKDWKLVEKIFCELEDRDTSIDETIQKLKNKHCVKTSQKLYQQLENIIEKLNNYFCLSLYGNNSTEDFIVDKSEIIFSKYENEIILAFDMINEKELSILLNNNNEFNNILLEKDIKIDNKFKKEDLTKIKNEIKNRFSPEDFDNLFSSFFTIGNFVIYLP